MSLSHLDFLEAESIHIVREAVAETESPALLFSGGKDSAVLLHLALKAFYPEPLPFPLLHIDTGHNFQEVIQFRDERVSELNVKLVIGHVEDSIQRGSVVVKEGESRNAHQSVTLLETIEQEGFTLLFGGARRDEEKARAKERVVSLRNAFGQWNPQQQRPELWELYNFKHQPQEHLRVFPLSNWTELDIWTYIAQEKIKLPSLYFSHTRTVIPRAGLWVPLTPLTPLKTGEHTEEKQVRFRTVGDITCTCPVLSDAKSIDAIIGETQGIQISERGSTRMDDQTSQASMEQRKREGYF
jgi:sulfate adenylyltransferase subunit 2